MGNEKTMTCSKKYLDIPVWRRYTLTIEEAAGYYHIGEGKLRMLIDEHPNEDFYVMNGNRALIKREKGHCCIIAFQKVDGRLPFFHGKAIRRAKLVL